MNLAIALGRVGAGSLVALLLLVLPSQAQAGLVFERLGGAAIQFDGTPRVWCGPWEDGVARQSLHVALRSARRGWELSAVRGDIELGRPIEFPNSFVSSRPRGAQLFVFANRIEASTAEEESSGSMTFSQATCRPGGLVEFRIRAVLGSELFSGRRVRVFGAYRGYAGEPPERSGRLPG